MKVHFSKFKDLIRSKGILGRKMILADAVKEYLEKKEASTGMNASL